MKNLSPLYKISYDDITDEKIITMNNLKIIANDDGSVKRNITLDFNGKKQELIYDLVICCPNTKIGDNTTNQYLNNTFIFWEDEHKNIYYESKNNFCKNMYFDTNSKKILMVNNLKVNYNNILTDFMDMYSLFNNKKVGLILKKLMMICSSEDIDVWDYVVKKEYHIYIKKYNVKFIISKTNYTCIYENYFVSTNEDFDNINKWIYNMHNMFLLYNDKKYYILMFPTNNKKMYLNDNVHTKYYLWKKKNSKKFIRLVYEMYENNNILPLNKTYIIPIHYSFNKILCNDVNVVLLYLLYNIHSKNLMNILNILEYVRNMTVLNVYNNNSPYKQIKNIMEDIIIDIPFFNNIVEIILHESITKSKVNITPKKLTFEYDDSIINIDEDVFLEKTYIFQISIIFLLNIVKRDSRGLLNMIS